MTPAPLILVFDIGGTTIRGALYEASSDTLRHTTRIETAGMEEHGESLGSRRDTLYRKILDLGREISGAAVPDFVGIAFPGPLDSESNAYAAPTIWGGTPTEPVLRQDFERLWPCSRVMVVNDVTAVGYRYLRGDAEQFCILTVSSGVGHKLFVESRAVTGPNGRGGEIGHLRVDWSDDALRCDCGGVGHLGAVASGRGTAESVRRAARRDPDGFAVSLLATLCDERSEDITTEMIVRAFHAGDDWTAALVGATARYLGRAIAALHLDSGVERFVVVGGFALALGEPFRRRLVKAAEEGGWMTGQNWDAMIEMGDDDAPGLLGLGRYIARSA
jgi:C7-cyclitol 7-kinase